MFCLVLKIESTISSFLLSEFRRQVDSLDSFDPQEERTCLQSVLTLYTLNIRLFRVSCLLRHGIFNTCLSQNDI